MTLSLLETQPDTAEQAEAFLASQQYRLWALGQLALSSRELELAHLLDAPRQQLTVVEV